MTRFRTCLLCLAALWIALLSAKSSAASQTASPSQATAAGGTGGIILPARRVPMAKRSNPEQPAPSGGAG